MLFPWHRSSSGGLAADPSPAPSTSGAGDKVALWVGGAVVGALLLKAFGVFDVR